MLAQTGFRFTRKMLRHLRAVRDLRGRARVVYLSRLGARLLGRSDATPAGQPRPRTVLFVCHGNIMRSALAEALLRARLGPASNIRVASAGTWATPSRAADPRMVRAARQLGVSLDEHRASALTHDLVEGADLIVVMDARNEADVLARYPQAAPRVTLLAELAVGKAGLEIADPYTHDVTAVDRCASIVDRCVTVLARSLVASP